MKVSPSKQPHGAPRLELRITAQGHAYISRVNGTHIWRNPFGAPKAKAGAA